VKARTGAEPGKVKAVMGSRLGLYMTEILRMEPCAVMFGLDPSDSSVAAEDLLSQAPLGARSAALAYIEQYKALLASLAAKFPQRVFVARSHEAALDKIRQRVSG
jgi:hypothetical protein